MEVDGLCASGSMNNADLKKRKKERKKERKRERKKFAALNLSKL